MEENNVNVDVENEEVKRPIYSSKFLMNKELFYDFCSVSYSRTKKIFLIFIACRRYNFTHFSVLRITA